MCTPGMGVNLWGVSPLYVNPVNGLNTLTKVLAEKQVVDPVIGGHRREGVFPIKRIGTGIHTLSILRIALKVSAMLHSVSLRAKC